MSYEDGAEWIYQADITNGAGGAGNHTYVIVAGAGNELEVLYFRLFNGDTSGRTARVRIFDADGGNEMVRLFPTGTLGAAGVTFWPVASSSGGIAAGAKAKADGLMSVSAEVDAVASSQDSSFAISCWIQGGVPTVTESGASTPTININTELVR